MARHLIFTHLVFGGLALAAVGGLAYVFYVSDLYAGRPDWEGGLRTRYLMIFGAALALAAGSFALSLKWRTNLAVFICSGVVSAYALEVFVAYSGTIDVNPPRSSGKLEYLAHLEKRGIEAYPHFVSEVTKREGLAVAENAPDRLQPLGAHSHQTTVFCNEGGTWRLQETDEHGFNNPKGMYVPGAVDAVVLGDSFTEGVCVDKGSDIAGQLRRYGLKSLNLGRQGNGPLSMLAGLTEYAAALKPRFVIWNYFEGNDLSDLNGDKDSQILPRYLDAGYSQNLITRQTEIDQAISAFLQHRRAQSRRDLEAFLADQHRQRPGRVLRLWHLRALAQLGQTRLQDMGPALVTLNNPASYDYVLFERILRTAIERTAAWGGELVFVYLPNSPRYFDPAKYDHGATYGMSKVLEIVSRLNVRSVDLHQVFRKSGGPMSLYSMLGGHFNERGYCLAAKSILTALARDLPAPVHPEHGC